MTAPDDPTTESSTSRRRLLQLATAGGLSLAAAALPMTAGADDSTGERNLVVYLPGVDGLEAGDALGIRRSDGKVEKLSSHLYAAGVHAFLPQRGRKGARLIPVVVAGVTRVKAERTAGPSGPIPGLRLGAGTPGIARLGGSMLGIVLEPLDSDVGLIRILMTSA